MCADAFVHSHSPAQTQALARALGKLLTGGDTVALSGELGAGKTCFAQGLAAGLGVPEGVPITSPTFTLIGQYPGRVEMRHADFYRVESYARLEAAGFEDLLDGQGVLIVEWPERFVGALPTERIEIRIELRPELGDEVRRIEVRALGDRPAEICRRWQAQWP